jgi:hypothetical protein
VSKLTEEAIKDISQTEKAYLHEFLDINNRPVLVVVASKHFPKVSVDFVVINYSMYDIIERKKQDIKSFSRHHSAQSMSTILHIL